MSKGFETHSFIVEVGRRKYDCERVVSVTQEFTQVVRVFGVGFEADDARYGPKRHRQEGMESIAEQFETYIGTNIAPLVPLFKRFWFTRYGDIGSKKWAKFRFECDDITTVQPCIDTLIQKFQLCDQGYDDYNVASDIGCGEGSRFLGDNGRHHDTQTRGELAFNFLHAAALLFLDGLRGPDANGRFQREPECAKYLKQ